MGRNLLPWEVRKIPGTTDRTCELRRETTIKITSTATGALAVLFNPISLYDTVLNYSSFFSTTTGSALDGNTAPLTANTVAVAMNQRIAADTILAWKLVGCTVKTRCTAANMTVAGTGYTCTMPIINLISGTPGTSQMGQPFCNLLTIANIQAQPDSTVACLNDQEGSTWHWLPKCLDQVEPIEINNSMSAVQSKEPINAFAFLATGAANSSIFEFNVVWDFEYIPTSTALTAHCQTICPDSTSPSSVWRDVLLSAKTCEVTRGHNHSLFPITSFMNAIPRDIGDNKLVVPEESKHEHDDEMQKKFENELIDTVLHVNQEDKNSPHYLSDVEKIKMMNQAYMKHMGDKNYQNNDERRHR